MSALAAVKRASTHTARIAQARGDRARLFALVGWLLAEFYRLPAQVKDAEFERVVAVIRDWNSRSGS